MSVKHVLKGGKWVIEENEVEMDIETAIQSIRKMPKHIQKDFESSWNDIFMLIMSAEVYDGNFYKDVIPNILIARS
tara:strand:+ start:300 stop:527 length:228 start_codon:yes stop_codon:yes gene_type:complete